MHYSCFTPKPKQGKNLYSSFQQEGGEINISLDEQLVSLPGRKPFITSQMDLAVHRGNLIKWRHRPWMLSLWCCALETFNKGRPSLLKAE